MAKRLSNYTEFEEGYKAYLRSEPRRANPYSFGKDFSADDEPAVLWDMGWEEAWLDDK